MAEVTGLRNNALPYPVYGAPWGLVFPLLDADGDLVTGAGTPDSEVSKNGDTFADCTNEMVEIATNSGMYYLLLTATEMTADVVAVIAKSATAGMKTTPMVLSPRKLVTLRSGTVAANAADGTTLQLDSSASAVDDYYNGCLLVGTLDSNVEARIISDYVGSTKVCTVSPAFVTTPDNNDTFVVYVPDGGQQVSQIASDSIVASVSGAVGSVTGAVGSVTGLTASDVGAIKTKTDFLPSATAGAAGGVFIAGTNAATTITTSLTTTFTGNVTGSVGSVAGAVGSVTGNVTGSIGSLAAQAKADVNAEVLDVLATDTFAQPGQESPAATATLKNMLAYLYKAWRNKHTQTSSEYALYADDGSTKDQEAGVADDGSTFTRNEIQTGA